MMEFWKLGCSSFGPRAGGAATGGFDPSPTNLRRGKLISQGGTWRKDSRVRGASIDRWVFLESPHHLLLFPLFCGSLPLSCLILERVRWWRRRDFTNVCYAGWLRCCFVRSIMLSFVRIVTQLFMGRTLWLNDINAQGF